MIAFLDLDTEEKETDATTREESVSEDVGKYLLKAVQTTIRDIFPTKQLQ